VLAGRYSRAITAIEDLLTTWDSMSYVEKVSPTEIARLILDGEGIINDERLTLQRTGVQNASASKQKISFRRMPARTRTGTRTGIQG